MRISDVIVGDRFRKDLGDIDTLVKSIAEVGLLHPIVVNQKKELVAGARRIEACRKLGWTDIPVHIVDLDDLAKGEFHENAVRKEFTASEVVAIKRAIEPEIKEKAKERQKKHGGTAPGKSKNTCADSAQVKKPKTRDLIAKFTGYGRTTVSRMEKIVDAAEKDPETFRKILEDVDSGKTTVNYGYKRVKKNQPVETPPLPKGQYDVIYADPPWKYNVDFLRGSPEVYYSPMDTEDICYLKDMEGKTIQEVVSDDAVLFLWCTVAHDADVHRVMETWGFKYKSQMVWVKDRIGPGFYFRGRRASEAPGRSCHTRHRHGYGTPLYWQNWPCNPDRSRQTSHNLLRYNH